MYVDVVRSLPMVQILGLALAGALGTLCRAGLTRVVQRAVGLGFPWGTVTVNVLGSLLFGLAWALTEKRFADAAEIRLYVLTGFMGAFTTFSTFAFDTLALVQEERIGAALGNLALQNLLGVGAVLLGLWLGRAL